jgi:hypothetical protein
LKYFDAYIRFEAAQVGARGSEFKLSSDDIQFLQRIYVALDDPDSVLGVTCLRASPPSLLEYARECEAATQWDECLTAFSQGVMFEPSNIIYHTGLLKSQVLFLYCVDIVRQAATTNF